MLSLPGLESLSPVDAAPSVTPGQLSQPSSKAVTTGFSAILARYNPSTGETPASGRNGNGELPLQGAKGLPKGQSLPLLRQGEGLEAADSPADLVNDLSVRLDQLTGTIEQLLAQEDEGDASLSRFLADELGLDQESIDQVLQALNDWVENPPEVSVSVEQLLQMDDETLQQLAGLTDLLGDLDQELSRWLAQLDPESAVTEAGSEAMAGTSAPLEEWIGILRRLGDAPSDEPRNQPASPARFIAQTLQMVLNSTSNGSLPLSLDMGRPEAALISANAAQPSSDVTFNSTLLNMARESLGGKAAAGKDSSLQLASLTAAVEASGTEMGANLQSRPELASLERGLLRSIERPLVPGDMGRQLGERVFLMVQGEIKHATIRLDPPELGMMDIKVSVQNDQTQVQIIVHNPQVREALESQSTRLREFLEQQGLSLDNLDVRDESPGQDGNNEKEGGQLASHGDTADENGEQGETSIRQWRQGLVDDFV